VKGVKESVTQAEKSDMHKAVSCGPEGSDLTSNFEAQLHHSLYNSEPKSITLTVTSERISLILVFAHAMIIN